MYLTAKVGVRWYHQFGYGSLRKPGAFVR
jgi:hypothetical protein